MKGIVLQCLEGRVICRLDTLFCRFVYQHVSLLQGVAGSDPETALGCNDVALKGVHKAWSFKELAEADGFSRINHFPVSLHNDNRGRFVPLWRQCY